MSFVVTLPISPSVNAMYVNVPGKGRVKSAKAKAWTTKAGWWLKTARLRPLPPGPYAVKITVSTRLRGDADNRVKATLDLLVKHGLTPDDRYADSSVTRSPDIAPDQMLVVASPITKGRR